jgi:hypothetical protein
MNVNAATSNIPLEVMMTGDFAGAFRHVPFNCWFCVYFSGYIRELGIIVVNLCLPFDWAG